MKTDIRTIDADITASLAVIRGALDAAAAHDCPRMGTSCAVEEQWQLIDSAMVTVETFAAVALRVMAKANPSRVRSEARNVEIQARIPRVSA